MVESLDQGTDTAPLETVGAGGNQHNAVVHDTCGQVPRVKRSEVANVISHWCPSILNRAGQDRFITRALELDVRNRHNVVAAAAELLRDYS